jgi:SpoVK/Ycf46/Vps4 family AAA+-type ATPase
MFAIDKNNDFILIGSTTNNTTRRLDKGVYNLDIRSNGPMAPPTLAFVRNNDYTKGIVLTQGVFGEARNFFDNFFSESLREARQLLNMKNKVGVMFNGEPGTGKTFLAGQIAEEICQAHDAIAILVTKSTDYSGLLDSIREDDSDRTIILIIDEFEKTFREYDTDLLSFLSGANERNNTIIIATVNDTSKLPAFINDRPSRFEKTFKFSFSDETVLRSIVENMIPETYKPKLELDTLIQKIMEYKNISIDRIRHIIRDVIAATIEMNKTGIQQDIIIKSDVSLKKSIGFAGDTSDTINITDLLTEELGIDSDTIELKIPINENEKYVLDMLNTVCSN